MKNRRNFTKVLTFCLFLLVTLMPSMASASIGHSVSHFSHSFSSSSSSHSFSSSGSSLGNSSSITNAFWLFEIFQHPFLLFIIIIIYYFAKGKFSNSNVRQDNGYDESIPYDKTSIELLKGKDPNFSEEAFLSKVGNIFIQLQEAWMNKKWQTIRPFETDALFNMHEKQLHDYIDRNRTNVIENMAVLNTEIVRFSSNHVNDQIEVRLQVRLNDYVIDDYTKKVIEGNPKQDIYMDYLLTFIRKNGVATEPEKEHYHATQCPNCGANVSINAAGQCEYCESIISSGHYDWVLSKLTVISQN